jgi:hypothetical protein
MFPVRYELNVYILFRINSIFKGLTYIGINQLRLETIGDFLSRKLQGSIAVSYRNCPQRVRKLNISLIIDLLSVAVLGRCIDRLM